MKIIFKILVGMAIVGVITGCFILNFYIWKLQHPQAPTWTWWVKH